MHSARKTESQHHQPVLAPSAKSGKLLMLITIGTRGLCDAVAASALGGGILK